MTEQEQILYQDLQKKVLLEYREDPVALLEYDIPTSVGDLTHGVILFYPDRYLKVEGDVLSGEVLLEKSDRFEARVLSGCVALEKNVLGEEENGDSFLVCKATMSHKSAFFAIAKRLCDLADGKPVRYDERKMVSHCVKCGRPLRPGETATTCIRCRDKRHYVKELWKVLRSEKMYLFLSVFLFILVTLVNLISPKINQIMVDEYITPRNNQLLGFLSVIGAMLGVSILSRLLSVLRSRFLIQASTGVVTRLRDMVFNKVQELSVASIYRRTTGGIMQRITSDTSTIQNFLTNELPNILEQSLLLISVAIILIWYDWLLALLLILPLPIFLIAQRMFRDRTHRMYDRQWQCGSKVGTTLHDIFSGIRVVKAYGREKYEEKRFDGVTLEECRIRARNERFWAIFNPLVQFLVSFGEFILLYYAGNKVLSGEMTLGTMQMFSSYVSLIYGPIRVFSMIPRQITHVLNSIAKVFEIYDEDVDVADATDARDVKIQGRIEMKNVSFGYDEEREVLRNINLTVNPGEMIGIVGRSGVGKSTLINLVMRMYDVDEGEILIDGINIRNLSQESFRSQIGVVLQETFLFNGSIYDNIAYAKPDATKEEVIRASKLAGAHTFISKLPDAYQTYVGERGYTLSGGERQRVSIARALLHDPKILILDEATASLDTETEKQIQDALQNLIADRTTIAIAHRLSTLRNATRLIVLDKGTIAEQGTHEELMRQKGIYYGLVMAQRQINRMRTE